MQYSIVDYITSSWHLFYNWKFVPFDSLHPFCPPHILAPGGYHSFIYAAPISFLFFSFFFSVLFATLCHMEFLDQGSNLSLNCVLSHSCSNAESLTHRTVLGLNLCPSVPKTLLIQLCHSGNSSNFFLSFF